MSATGTTIAIPLGSTCTTIVTWAEPTLETWPQVKIVPSVPDTVSLTWWFGGVATKTTWTYGAEGTSHIEKVTNATTGKVAFYATIASETAPSTSSVVYGTWVGTWASTGRAVVPFSITLTVPRRT